MSFNVAVDGPAGAGKSTIARAAAKRLHLIYVDTGAMYRAMGLFVLQSGIDPEDTEAVAELCGRADISIRYQGGEQVVLLNGENVNDQLRTGEVSGVSSVISTVPQVRAKMVSLQKKLAAQCDCIMDGRDIGTCVLPDAQLKVYLTADSGVRAKRRFDELTQKGQDCSLEQIRKDMEERDYRDMHREISPLRQAPDAVLLDTSHMTPEEATERLTDLCREKMG